MAFLNLLRLLVIVLLKDHAKDGEAPRGSRSRYPYLAAGFPAEGSRIPSGSSGVPVGAVAGP